MGARSRSQCNFRNRCPRRQPVGARLGGAAETLVGAVVPRRVRDVLVVAALVAEKGGGEETAAEQDREEDSKDGRDHQVDGQIARRLEIEQCPSDHRHGRHQDPLHHSLEFSAGSLPIVGHVQSTFLGNRRR